MILMMATIAADVISNIMFGLFLTTRLTAQTWISFNASDIWL